jgi:hypothetical protein
MPTEVLPAHHPTAVLVVRCQHLITGLDIEAGGHSVHALRGITGEHHLLRVGADELRRPSPHLVHLGATPAEDLDCGVALDLAHVGGDRIDHHAE